MHTLYTCLVGLSGDFTLLQASLDSKGSFSDIERLHNVVYAYGATMVEAVRRKEFCTSL
jgi:autophagy-related protein 11